MTDSVKLPDKNAVCALLDQEKINYKVMDHEPLKTIPPAIEYFTNNKPEVEGKYVYCKNLFLKNKKGGFYLLTAHHDTKIDYKNLCKIFKTGNGNIREGEKDKLEAFLHCEQGHVNSFSMLNTTEEQRKEIQFHLDKTLEGYDYVGIPPMQPTSTVWIKVTDLKNLLEKHGIKVNVTDFNDVPAPKESEKKKEDKKKDDKKKDKKNKDDEDNDISSLGIVNKKEKNFSDWYSECIVKSEMVDYYEISGCYILRPWSYEIWEEIQHFFDGLIKEIGVKNAYFPLFVSQKALYKEKEHVEGFSPEVAWVTKSGKSEINPPIAIRPTSETIMYPAFAKWIRSHRDLPLMLNQWTNIVRWEFKNPTPFIRTREFLWQEGHTAHATFEEAEKIVYKILDFYARVYEELLCCPVIKGIKSENEKFAGGFYTTSIESMLPNGKGVQCATSHHLGQNFSKMCEITFLDKEKKKQYVWQTSWGLTTRTIGVMVMMHGDNDGLVLPPKVAPIQVVIIPIKTSKDDPKVIQEKGEEMYKLLKDAGVKVFFDDSEIHNPGWKYAQWELKGVPIRIEYGNKDLSKDQVTFFIRYNKEKFPVKLGEVKEKIFENLDKIQKAMLEKCKKLMDDKKSYADNFDEFLKGMNLGNLVYTHWCKDSKCEDDVKAKVKEIAALNQEEETVGTCKTLCIPLDQSGFKKDKKCFFCGKDAQCEVVWGRSY